jgi:hypothetical protein
MNARYSHALNKDQHLTYTSDRGCFVGLASPVDYFPCPVFCFTAPQHVEEQHLRIPQGSGYWITACWQGASHSLVRLDRVW